MRTVILARSPCLIVIKIPERGFTLNEDGGDAVSTMYIQISW